MNFLLRRRSKENLLRNIDHWKNPLYMFLIRPRALSLSVSINKSKCHTYCRLGTRAIIYVNLSSCTHVYACQTAEQPISHLPSHPCVINVDTEFSIFTKNFNVKYVVHERCLCLTLFNVKKAIVIYAYLVNFLSMSGLVARNEPTKSLIRMHLHFFLVQ